MHAEDEIQRKGSEIKQMIVVLFVVAVFPLSNSSPLPPTVTPLLHPIIIPLARLKLSFFLCASWLFNEEPAL